MPTLSQENYLKTLWHLAFDGKVTLQRLASHLGISPASALAMVRRLVAAKLVTYHRRSGIRLTAKGRAAALDVIRRHRLWEHFLATKLGYRWDEVHGIAEELEHINIPDLADRLDAFLGFPAYDPHGDPIPQKDGTVPPTSALILSEQPPGYYRLVGLKRTDPALLQHIEQVHLRIGQCIELLERLPYDQAHIINVEGERQHLSQAVAAMLLVEPCS